jgi:dolichyl-phosphate beta-glucosyltransferase
MKLINNIKLKNIDEISIVIPCYNEEKRIIPTLKEINNYCSKHFKKYELIIVDDGSKDNTIFVIKELKLKNIKIILSKTNNGKGFVVKKGMLLAKYKYVLFSDADLATPIEELEKLDKYVDRYDVVIASRKKKGANLKIKQPFKRRLMGNVFSWIISLFIVSGYKDTQCGFKLFKQTAAKQIFSKVTLNGWLFDVEVLFLAKKLRFNVKELGVVWIDKEGSKVNFLRDLNKVISEFFKIRMNQIKGKYR